MTMMMCRHRQRLARDWLTCSTVPGYTTHDLDSTSSCYIGFKARLHRHENHTQWIDLSLMCRSGSVRSSHQTLSGASKNYFYLPFLTQVFRASWCETCRVSNNSFEWVECDILGSINILWPLLYIFLLGSQHPTTESTTLSTRYVLSSCTSSLRYRSPRISSHRNRQCRSVISLQVLSLVHTNAVVTAATRLRPCDFPAANLELHSSLIMVTVTLQV